MEFNLTASQKNFHTKNDTIDSTLWNQGVMQVFPKRYSYKELNDAYNNLVRDNDSLRITMRKKDDGHIMYLKQFEYIEYPFWSVTSEEELMCVAQQFLNEPIDLYGILVKCAVFETPTTSGIMISGHHTVVDGYSAFVMAEHINNYLKDPHFSPSHKQYYEDYIENEERHKTTKRFISDKNFWLEKFSQQPVCTLFPAPPTTLDYTSSELNIQISGELFSKIKAFCSKNEISVQTFFNTVHATYIHKKFNFEKFTIGVPVLNRTTAAELNTIGLYMHIVPLVISINEDTFLEQALEIEDSQLSLFRHQKFTQFDIKEALKNNGTPTNQLFDIVCDYQEFRGNNDYEMRLPYSNYLSTPIEIHIQSFNDKKHNLKIRYRTSYFTNEEIEIMMISLINITEDALRNPSKKINQLEVLSDNEKEKLLKTFNDTAHTYDVDTCETLYSLFEKTAKDNPDKICIKADGKEITFGNFKNKAEVLDYRIRAITETKKSVVAIICERSFEMYSAIYGIIRGGNAYLPIDPDYPQDRIDYILKNSNAALVVAQDKFTHLVSNLPCIDMTELINGPTEEFSLFPPAATEDDTAYVIYTSGSTGNPKGAKVSHKSAVNRILWMHDKYPLLENDVILQKTPYTFDVSVWEHFWWGITGGTLAVSKPGEHFLPAKILDEVFNNRVTHLHFVPSVFELFLNYLEAHKGELYKFNTVKFVFLSGEALTANLVKRFYALFDYNKITLHNLYGPTECAVDVTYYDCSPADTDPVPIGKPIYNTQMYVVDKFMNPVPLGVTGELCIAGANVGQGYLNNEELTNEKFIDNPFGSGKLYKTGDLAYWREDGNIIFVGRNDFQVKIHGQRIELGEIENAITSVDGVIQSTVVVKKGNDDIQFICAFYTGKEIDVKELRSLLSSKLPKYMVPHSFTHLDEMPLTSSGKISRSSLPEIDFTSISAEDEYAAPKTAEETALANVICSVLKTSINMLDNFFNIGGDSIKAIYVVSELEEMGYELHIADIMQNDTLSDIAKAMVSTSDKAIYDQGEVNGFIPFTPIMRAYLKENNEIKNDFVQTCVISADCNEDIAKKALDALVSHHDILRGTFAENGIEIHPSNERRVYSFKVVTIDDTDKAKEYLNKTSLEEDKLVNVVFCKTEKETFLGITIHHFLIDLVSWEILMKDFKTVVNQLKNNEEIALPTKTASFMMWNKKLQKYSETMPVEIKEYWKNINNALDNTKRISSDEENEEERYNYTFDKTISDKLINEANNIYGTRTNEILLTALGLAASKIANGSVGINVEGHGRTELDNPVAIEHTVGWFTSCYPVVVNNNSNATEELINIKETMRRIPKNGIDYLLLSQGLHKNTDIIFNFYNNNATDDDLIAFYADTSLFSSKINVNCTVADNTLTAEIVAPFGQHKYGISEELGVEFVKHIKNLIELCTTSNEVIKTRSDFSDDELTESELEELIDLFDWTDDNE